MRVLMLGWEFPPFISGGLGTACYGLTKALNRRGVEVLFVLPRSVELRESTHVRILSAPMGADSAPALASLFAQSQSYQLPGMEHVKFRTVPSRITSPYPTFTVGDDDLRKANDRGLYNGGAAEVALLRDAGLVNEGDYVSQARRYALLCEILTRGEQFDVIHAHDWMTWPAAQRLSQVTGKPVVAHVHSTEFDRSGDHAYDPILQMERDGMRSAAALLCVSHTTRAQCVRRFGAAPDRALVCYNGIDQNGGPPTPREPIRKGDKIVLFLGRITMQKGPEYFIAAAKLVLEKFRNVRFVMAGSGDMERTVARMAREMGIEQKVVFTGFLSGSDVDRVFDMADVYVMPSVAEPFGIAPLEAIRHDVPVILSRHSGVSEVLHHVLKVDFWDVRDIADKIIAVLRYPPLGKTLRKQAEVEVRSLTWDAAAQRCAEVYEKLTAT